PLGFLQIGDREGQMKQHTAHGNSVTHPAHPANSTAKVSSPILTASRRGKMSGRSGGARKSRKPYAKAWGASSESWSCEPGAGGPCCFAGARASHSACLETGWRRAWAPSARDTTDGPNRTGRSE